MAQAQTEYEIVEEQSVPALKARVNEMLHDEQPWSIVGGMSVLPLREGPRYYQAMVRFASRISVNPGSPSRVTFPAAGNGNNAKANKVSA